MQICPIPIAPLSWRQMQTCPLPTSHRNWFSLDWLLAEALVKKHLQLLPLLLPQSFLPHGKLLTLEGGKIVAVCIFRLLVS